MKLESDIHVNIAVSIDFIEKCEVRSLGGYDHVLQPLHGRRANLY